MDLRTLTADEVKLIHLKVVASFAKSQDPIAPSGVRSEHLLESAISRQTTSLNGTLKYPQLAANAATLMYGICNDHPFHNGNKRTALVSMLVHLDKNKHTLYDTTESELYELMIKTASHRLLGGPDKRAKLGKIHVVDSDEEVEFLTKWIGKHIDRVRRGERQITYRELRSILGRFGFHMTNPNNNQIDVVSNTYETRGWLTRKQVRVTKHIGSLPWPGEHCIASISVIKSARKLCKLREEEGIDSDAFYDETLMIDSFVNKYRTTLRKLADT